jgi:hypothetical protein
VKVSRDELVAFLTRVVANGVLRYPTAVTVLRKFEAGTLPKGFSLPIPPEEFITGLTREMIDEALA